MASNKIQDFRSGLQVKCNPDGTISLGNKNWAFLTTAITANSTLTSLAAGTFGATNHSTGRDKIFVSDGTKWQNFSPGTAIANTVAALTENGGAVGGTNDGDLPSLTATYTARTSTVGGTANGAYEDEGTLSTSNTYTDAAVNTVIGKLKNNIAELATVVAQLAADNVALRAAARENAAKQNAVISALKSAGLMTA